MSDATQDLLVVQVEGGRGSPERVLRVVRLGEGRVRVDEWSSADGALPTHETSAAELLAELERLYVERRRLSLEMYELRRWLGEQ
jgi:hypothetical protein